MPDLSNETVFPHSHLVKALIAPEYRWRLIEEYGSDCFTPQEDGKLLFSFGFTDEDTILGCILSFQGGAELLEPAALRKRLIAFGQMLQKQYSDS